MTDNPLEHTSDDVKSTGLGHNDLRLAMTQEKDTPTPPEIQKQLKRILASDTFATNPTPRKLIETIVTRQQAGVPITEVILGILVCNKPQDWDPKPRAEGVIRQQGVTARKLLHEYYSTAGKEDLVIIDVPKRNGYLPKYRYNAMARSLGLYEHSVAVFEQTFPQIFPTATRPVLETLGDSLRENDSYAPAHAAVGEILLLYTMCDEPTRFPPEKRVPAAEKAARRCLSLDPTHWLGHVVAGAVHCCHFEWEKAASAFEIALRIDKEKTIGHFFYLAYLVAVGRMDEAIENANRRRKASADNELVYLPEVLFRYITRKFEEAYQQFMHLSKAWDHIGDQWKYACGVEILVCNYWPTEMLLACIALATGHDGTAYRYGRSGAQHSKLNCYAGINAVALGSLARKDDTYRERIEAMMGAMEANPEWFGPVNMALIYMAFGCNQEAIKQLGKACDDLNPLMAWLHLWPILDPLREEEDFKALIRRMNLPASALASAAAWRVAAAAAAAAAEEAAVARRNLARRDERLFD